MPVRPRRQRHDRHELTPRLTLALIVGPDPQTGASLSDRFLRAVWAEHRERLLSYAHPERLPWAFWEYEAPAQLRSGRPQLVPVDAPASSARDARRLALARRTWLAEQR